MPLNSAQRSAVAQVKEFTGCSDRQAADMLRRTGWDPTRAADALFASGFEPPAAAFDEAKILALFERYAAPGDDEDEEPYVHAEGVVQLCEDVGVDAGTDPLALVIAEHMGARVFARFEKAEWVKGFRALEVDSLEGLREKVPRLRARLEDPDYFKRLFQYTFKFAASSRKNLAKDQAAAYIGLLLPTGKWALSDDFCEFLTSEGGFAGQSVPEDTWRLTLDFAQRVEPDLSNYDDDESGGAWPVMHDEFVDWLREKRAA